MKHSIILLLTLLIAINEVDGQDFEINTFLDNIQKNGYYEIIYEVKCEYGNDVAIEFCKLFLSSPYCEEVVRVYMPDCSVPINICNIRKVIYKEENFKIIKKYHTDKQIVRNINILETKFKCEKWLDKNEERILLLILFVIIFK